MKKMFIFVFCAMLFSAFTAHIACGQQADVWIHSHNDYLRCVPFYEAYSQRISSMEADVFFVDGPDILLVAHSSSELLDAPSLDEAYIQPLVKLYKQNNGRAWQNSDKTLNLLIDLKTPTHPTIDKVIEHIQRYPEIFDTNVNPYAVQIIITGNIPEAAEFASYPSFIMFDGNRMDYTLDQLKRIAIISLDFKNYSTWNGKGNMVKNDYDKVTETIKKVHALGKPVRFWGAPDGITAWNTYYNIGVDYINTDNIEECAAFFRDFRKKTFHKSNNNNVSDLALAKRLDKTTSDFGGFDNKYLQLSQKVKTYTPTYRNDGKSTVVKNVILMIGDGMGLAQICAADAVNKGLTLLNMKYIGLLNTEAADDYTTDSAAGGSALATGRKHDNRHISINNVGEAMPSLTDIFQNNGYACGVVTLGNIADATPAAFYAHSTERDNSDEITACLTKAKLTLLSGSGMKEFTNRNDGKNLISELKIMANYNIVLTVDSIGKTKGKVICLDERMGEAASEQTLSLLADATREAVQKLTSENKKGFFLMVEGAKIDYAGHANSLSGTIIEMLSFDLAIAEAIKFADANGETLVLVTADHETGGLTLLDGYQEKALLTAYFVTDDHTPIRVPLFAYGPSAQLFTGAYQNTEVFHKIMTIFKQFKY